MTKFKSYIFSIIIFSLLSCKVSNYVNRNPELKTTYIVNSTYNSDSISNLAGIITNLSSFEPPQDCLIYFKEKGVVMHIIFVDSSSNFKVNNIKSGKYSIQIIGSSFKTDEIPIEIAISKTIEVKISILPEKVIYL